MKLLLTQNSKYSAFTLIEFLIVIFIIVILSVIIIVNYEFGGYQLTLQRSAHKLVQDLREAEEMAMSAKEFEGSVPPGGYGIYLNLDEYTGGFRTSYILFADNNGDYKYDGSEMIEEIALGEHIRIEHLFLQEEEGPGLMPVEAFITFTPPDPVVRIAGGFGFRSIIVTLGSKKTNETIMVSVNRTGLIEVGLESYKP